MIQCILRLILWILNCILSSFGYFLMHQYILNECGQCVFFGHVEEVKRHFTGGSQSWCLFIVSGCVVSFVNGVVVVSMILWNIKYKVGKMENCLLVSKPKYLLMVKISLLWTFTTALVCAAGIMVFCSSFEINSCSANKNQDWHAFTPKHSDCFGAYFWQVLLNVVMWLCFLIQSYDYSKTVVSRT